MGSESSGTLAIKSYLGTLADEETQKLQDVCDGKEVETDINDSMNYDSLSQHNAKDMWSLLLHTGYLTATKVISQKKCVVRIPNDEIRECFRDSIMESFNEALSSGGKGARLAKALFDGDGRTCEEIMGLMLRRYVSNRVRAARTPENFYEGFMSGLLASIGYRQDELGVEHEAGDGFSDIVIKDPDGRRAAVLELKSSANDRSMVPDARRAVAQIEEKRYARELRHSLLRQDLLGCHERHEGACRRQGRLGRFDEVARPDCHNKAVYSVAAGKAFNLLALTNNHP